MLRGGSNKFDIANIAQLRASGTAAAVMTGA